MRTLSVFVLTSAVLLSGCSTLFWGTQDEVELRSEPAAQVQVDRRTYNYETPLSVDLDRREAHTVRFQKKGYEERKIDLQSQLNWGGLGSNMAAAIGVGAMSYFGDGGAGGGIAMSLVVGAVSVGTDFLTGAAYRIEPDQLDVQLKKLAEPVEEPPANRIAEAPAPGYTSTVDTSIPKTSMDRPDDVAVVIGVKEYEHTDIPDVDYALRDAEIMKRYLTRTLGFREDNVIFAENAGGSVLERIFGTESEPKGQLYNWVKDGQSDVFVYYSGHGAPDPETEEAYLVASDTDPSYLPLNGYSVNQLYENLATLPARSVTVVLESCFSGVSEAGTVVPEVSPAVLSVENPMVGVENGLAITAGAADQVSSWYGEKKHGLFTYYFLKGLRGAADEDGNKAVTAEELDRYLSEKVPYQAARQHNRKQTPQVVGRNLDRVLVEYTDNVPANERRK